MATEYGDATLHKNHDTGEVTVVEADDVIGVSPALWDEMEPAHRPDDETLVLDTAGLYRYRKIGEQSSRYRHDVTVLIFERIQEAS